MPRAQLYDRLCDIAAFPSRCGSATEAARGSTDDRGAVLEPTDLDIKNHSAVFEAVFEALPWNECLHTRS